MRYLQFGMQGGSSLGSGDLNACRFMVQNCLKLLFFKGQFDQGQVVCQKCAVEVNIVLFKPFDSHLVCKSA